MADAALLASCSSDGIKLWKVDDAGSGAAPLTTLKHHLKSVKCVKWNHNNQVVASAGADGKVFLSHAAEGSVLQTIAEEIEEISCLSFTTSSRFLAMACASRVLVYDIKEKHIANTFQSHGSQVTSVSFNLGDGAHLLSGCTNGDIFLHNIQLNSTVGKLSTSVTSSGVRSVLYSSLSPNNAASAHEDGCVVYWNVVDRKAAIAFQQHHAAVTALAFSPISAALLVSVGLDGRVVFYDVEAGKVVKNVHTGMPLTALSFMGNGCTLAVGSLGTILILDLRRDDDAIISYRAQNSHAGEINWLQFQSVPRNSKRSAPAATVTSRSLSSASVSSASATRQSEWQTPRQAAPYTSVTATPTPAFSPVKARDAPLQAPQVEPGMKTEFTVLHRSADDTSTMPPFALAPSVPMTPPHPMSSASNRSTTPTQAVRSDSNRHKRRVLEVPTTPPHDPGNSGFRSLTLPSPRFSGSYESGSLSYPGTNDAAPSSRHSDGAISPPRQRGPATPPPSNLHISQPQPAFATGTGLPAPTNPTPLFPTLSTRNAAPPSPTPSYTFAQSAPTSVPARVATSAASVHLSAAKAALSQFQPLTPGVSGLFGTMPSDSASISSSRASDAGRQSPDAAHNAGGVAEASRFGTAAEEPRASVSAEMVRSIIREELAAAAENQRRDVLNLHVDSVKHFSVLKGLMDGLGQELQTTLMQTLLERIGNLELEVQTLNRKLHGM
eukprot:TRINITY_DN5544_c0_g1_i1.p1 TRINITY_DN5544_c0_g1~~TRINITY_DN5544_c0_g1_i1.p1  ORF type:complete len:722 (+),score=91.73 TRINITY_DN5544_c0_g1_i1:43-2208(+)